jgi:hypothetical protein
MSFCAAHLSVAAWVGNPATAIKIETASAAKYRRWNIMVLLLFNCLSSKKRYFE